MSTLHELEGDSGIDLAGGDYWAQSRLGILRRWIESRHPNTVLDVGCGSGYLASTIDKPERNVYGIDIDADLIEIAKARESDAEFSIGDARNLNFSNDMADIVVIADVIEHFDNPTPLLREAERVCREDGSIILSVPAYKWLYGPHDSRQGHATRYSVGALREQAEEADLLVERHRYTNFIPLLPYAIYQRVLKRDVPASTRGTHASSLVEYVKSLMLTLEHRIRWPTGVTLLSELTPEIKKDENNIVLTNYEYPPECGGGGVFTRDLCTELRDRDVSVHLVAGQNRSASMPNNVLDVVSYPFRSYGALKRIVKHRQPALIHGHFSLPTSLFLPFIKRKYDVPYVVSVMGADVYDPTRYRMLRPYMDIINSQWVFRYADAITVASSDMYYRIPEEYHDKTEIIPYFVDTQTYSPGPSFGNIKDSVKMLTVARLVPRKNICDAIRAVENCRDNGINVEYTIVGSGSEAEALQKMVVELGLEDVVTFTGYVPDEELVEIYREHDVFVLPSAHEGFGIVLMEAMACGLPIISTRCGGPEDIVTDDVGRLIEMSVSEYLPAALDAIVGDYVHLADNARQRALEHYSVSEVVEQYRNLYRGVVD